MADETMLGNLKVGINELLHNKKFLMGITSSLAAIIARLAGKLGLPLLDPETCNMIALGIIGLASVTILGQGVADAGKEAAQVKANAAAADNAAVPPPAVPAEKPPT